MRRVSISLCLVLLMISSAWADTYTVSPGESIQDAIDLAGPNDTIEVAAGHYEGQLHIYTENLTIVGAGKTATFVDSPASLPLFFGTNYPVVFIDGVDNVTISDLTVDGLGRGDANYRFQGIAFWNSGGSLQDLHVVNIMDTPFSGAQHGVGVYAYNDTGGPYTVNITDVEIDAFQKNATALSGDGLTANLLRVVMTGAGATDVTAQNCIQIGFGASGTATDCQVYDVHYTPSSWAATGVLGYDGGTMDLDNVTVDGCGTGIDFYEISGSVDGCTVQNPYGDALYAENGGAKAGGRRTCQPFPEDRPAGTAKGAVSVVVTDSEFYGNEVVDSWGPSAYVLGPVDFVMTGSTVSGWDWGMVIYESGGIATGYAHDNTLAGNTTYDAYFQMAGEFDASMNFWGGNDPHDVTGYGTKGPPKLSPWYLLPPGSIPMSWGVKGTIQDAINAANPNDTINVAAGVYDEMLNVNKPLTLNGANAGVHPVVGKHPTELVGTRGPETDLSHNGLYAMRPSADNITVDGFLFSGDGGRIIDTYADANGFHLTNCIFENDATATSQGVIQFGGGSHTDMTIDFNLFQDEGDHTLYTGGGPYDRLSISWNKFNVLGDALFWTASTLVDGVIQGNELDGTIGGVPGTGGCTFNAGEMGNVQVLDNHAHDVFFTPFQMGIIGGAVIGNTFERIHPYAGYYGVCLQLWGGEWGTPVSNDVTISDNIFYFNDVAGVADPVHGIDLRPGSAPDPGIDGTTIVCRNNQFLDGGVLTTALAIQHRSDSTKWVDAIDNWWGSPSGPYHLGLNPSGTGARVGDYVTFSPWLGDADVEALPAASGPINCGETVTLDFHYTPDAFTPDLRGFTITVGCSAELTFGAGDIGDLDVLGAFGTDYFYVIDNGDGTFTIDSAVLGGSTGLAAEADLFQITFHPVGTGPGTVTLSDVELRDLSNGDIVASVAGATITVDCTAPPGVTDLTSAPGHEKVTLDWTMADESDVDHYEIWRAVWHTGDNTTSAYPEYDDDNPLEPVWPANHAAAVASLEWTKLTTIPDPLPGTALGYVDSGAPRGVYYYEVYAVDAADNIGPGAGPMNRATNYWLGDVDTPYDGDVDVPDIDELASTYGWGTGDIGYKPEVDVGPTDTNGGFGIPETDSEVDFEDLMIFALNFGNVAPRLPAGGTETPVFVWQRIDATTWALVLAEPCADLKGLHLRAPLPEGATCEVSLGDLLTDQSGPGFAANAPERGLDAGVALLGRGASICGQGELVRVSFSQDVQISPRVSARDASNGNLEVSLTTETEAVTPLRFAARPSYPNPFNPKTTISYDLPETRAVRVAVYAVDGSLVRMLVDGEMPAGSHEVVWDGRDAHRQYVASGTYFYRIDAGADSQVHKMMLMK